MSSYRFLLRSSAALLAVVGVLGIATAASADWIYDFEACTVGNTVESSSKWWTTLRPNIYLGKAVTSSTSGDYIGSKVLSADSFITGSTYLSTYAHNDGTSATSFGLSATTPFSIQADFQWNGDTGTSTSADPALILGPIQGSTAATDGRSPYFGFRYGYITLREIANDNNPVFADVAFNAISGLNANDWITLKMNVDPAANGGKGTAELLYKNLTDQDTSWTTLGSGNLHLDKLSGGAEGLANMGAIWIQQVRGTSAAPAGCLDNLVVSIVPEPSAMILVGCGMIALLCCTWRRRK